MNNSSAEQALIQIEQNLTKLESARKQVLDVTSQGREISTIMIELVKKIQEVYDIINFESETFVANYQKTQIKLDQNTEKLLHKSRESLNLFIAQLNADQEKIADSIQKNIKSSTVQSATFLTAQQKEFHKHVNVLNDFSNLLESFKKSIADNAVAKTDDINEVKILIKKTSDNIVADIDFSENINIKNHNELSHCLSAFHKESLEVSKLNHDESSKQHSSTFDGLKLQIKASSSEIMESIANFERGYLVQHQLFLERLDQIEQQNERLHKENNEILKAISNKKAANMDYHFYITWLLIFFGLIVSVYLLKRF